MPPKGRPTNDVVADNFKKDHQLANQSRRWMWHCNWCPATSPLIEGRNNHLVKHLSTCEHANIEERNRALTYLANSGHSKGKTVFGVSAASRGSDAPAGGIAPTQLAQAGAEDSSADASPDKDLATPGGKVIPKKRKGETLKGWVDFPMTEGQTQVAHLRLLRCVSILYSLYQGSYPYRFFISANVPFLSENHRFLEFVTYIRPAYEAPL